MGGLPPRVLTEERVAEINERIRQGGFAAFLGSLLGDDSERTSEVSYAALDRKFAGVLGDLMKNLADARVRYVGDSRPNDDPKRLGGISPLLTIRRLNTRRVSPRFIDTNVEVWGTDSLGRGPRVLFFPDVLLLYDGKSYEAVPYGSLSVGGGTIRCAEVSPHEWAEVVGHTWVRTNLDGGPDRRHSGNLRIPIVLYHLVTLESSEAVFRLPLLVPHEEMAGVFRGAFREAIAYAGSRGGAAAGSATGGRASGTGSRAGPAGDGDGAGRGEREKRRPPEHLGKPDAGSAREVLGVGPDASQDEILTAYRKMARQYHPDRVEGLGPEFKELAERRMKEINAAYAELTGPTGR